jgi:hypothetical protein
VIPALRVLRKIQPVLNLRPGDQVTPFQHQLDPVLQPLDLAGHMSDQLLLVGGGRHLLSVVPQQGRDAHQVAHELPLRLGEPAVGSGRGAQSAPLFQAPQRAVQAGLEPLHDAARILGEPRGEVIGGLAAVVVPPLIDGFPHQLGMGQHPWHDKPRPERRTAPFRL